MVVSHSCLNEHFSVDILCWTSFLMRIFYLYTFFSEAPFRVFCPFFNWVVHFLFSFKCSCIFFGYVFCKSVLAGSGLSSHSLKPLDFLSLRYLVHWSDIPMWKILNFCHKSHFPPYIVIKVLLAPYSIQSPQLNSLNCPESSYTPSLKIWASGFPSQEQLCFMVPFEPWVSDVNTEKISSFVSTDILFLISFFWATFSFASIVLLFPVEP